jgi:hypothetical protein
MSTLLISKKYFDSFDLFNWWKVLKDQFPLLFVVVRKVLGIPATLPVAKEFLGWKYFVFFTSQHFTT